MTVPIEHLVAEMVDVLDAENAALEGAQLAIAATLLSRKQAAANALQGALRARDTARITPEPTLRPAAERLRTALALNDALLSRALTAQQKLVELLLTHDATDQTRGLYGRGGGYRRPPAGASDVNGQWSRATA